MCPNKHHNKTETDRPNEQMLTIYGCYKLYLIELDSMLKSFNKTQWIYYAYIQIIIAINFSQNAKKPQFSTSTFWFHIVDWKSLFLKWFCTDYFLCPTQIKHNSNLYMPDAGASTCFLYFTHSIRFLLYSLTHSLIRPYDTLTRTRKTGAISNGLDFPIKTTKFNWNAVVSIQFYLIYHSLYNHNNQMKSAMESVCEQYVFW